MRNVRDIAKIIEENHGKLYLVGGAVRDKITGMNSHDEDYCVTGISASKFKELFPEAFARGKAFAIFDIDGKEFALARRERKAGLGHKEFEIETGKYISIEEDLSRRDITINAIAEDVLTGEIIDPYGGTDDLKNGLIKAVTDHFKEDPLRAYRVARFAAKFGFKVDDATMSMIKSLKKELNTLSVERVYTELSKAILAKKPSIFFEVLRKSDILEVHFKEISNLIGAEQPLRYHPEGDAYNHTMIVLDKVAENTQNQTDQRKLEIRFAALVHDIGKGETPKEEYPHHYMHEERGRELVKSMGLRLKLPNALIECGKIACTEHMKGGNFNKMTPAKKVAFIEKVDKSLLKLEGLQVIVNADNKNAEDFCKIGNRCLEEIDGNFIRKRYNIKPGRAFGERLHQERVEWMRRHQS